MEVAVLPSLPVLALATAVVVLWAQGGPPGPLPRPRPADPANHVADLHQKLASMKAVDVTAQRALAYGREFLASAEQSIHSGHRFEADRLAEAADSLIRVAEHQEHLRAPDGPKGPPASSAELIRDHLQRVYFRTQQADYFLNQSHDSRAAYFPKWARDFYQLALRDYDRKDFIAADENAKSSDDVVRALESLAQAGVSRPNQKP